MVRRLIQRFLHWLRQLLTNKHRAKQSSRPVKASHQLPPPVQLQTRVPPQSPTIKRSQSHPKSSHQPPSDKTPKPQSPRTPLNPASPRAANSSRFKVLFSDYKYSPSTAVQDLSRQLSHPEPTKALPEQKQSKTPPPTSFQGKVSSTPKIPASDPQEQPKQSITLPFQQENIDSPKTNNTNQQVSTISISSEQSIVEETVPSHIPSTSPQTSTTPITTSNSITKQGIVKLLFKLKKNNHHGYIAPEDGSKDIIFHKKFIGDDVFSQLERGMKVEVTAHITEGKAYADQIRIL